MWRVLLLELIAVLVIAGVWFGGPQIGLETVLARLGLIGALFVPPLIFLLVKLLVGRKRGKGLESALSSAGEGEADTVRPDRRPEIEALQQRFQDTVASLRSSRLGGSPLYALPWYMIIGPPGVGKSTALRQSGLDFPFSAGDDGPVRGVGGTRNCDWWFSDQAVLLDTAGRYTVEDDDKQEWLAFLGMLKRHRRKRPLNGLIVCMSVADLLAAEAVEVEAHAARIRERIDELLDELEVALPVYVLLTKCDLMAGFVESFGQMKKSVRAQVMGFTTPLGVPSDQVEATFSREFNLLAESVRKRATFQLAVAKPALRPGIFQFPRQLAAAHEPLAAFVRRMFSDNPYRATPLLRGVYFCSGTQEGRPIDRVVNSLASSLGLRAAPALDQAKAQKSYFLHDLFTKVIFADRDLAGTSSQGRSRRRKLQLAALVAGIALASAVATFSATSYRNNRELISSTVSVARQSRLGQIDDAERLRERLRAVSKLSRRIAELERFAADGPPSSYRLGFYSGGHLLGPARAVFGQQMRRLFVDPVGDELEALVGAIPSSGARDAAKAYDTLKAYMMVTAPARLDVAFAAPRLRAQWEGRLDPEVAQETELLDQLVRGYLELLKRGRVKWRSPQRELIAAAQRALRESDVGFRRLVDAADSEVREPLTLRGILGRVPIHVTARNKVPGQYTRRGWKLYARAKLSEGGGGGAWVLGGSKSGAEVGASLRERYFARYRKHWRGFLRGLALTKPGSLKDSLALLKALTDEPSLHHKLLSAVAYQTRLPTKQEELLEAGAGAKGAPGKALGKLAGKARRSLNSVEREFKPLWELVTPPEDAQGKPQVAGLSQYIGQLALVRDAVEQFLGNPDSPDAAPLNKALADAKRVTDRLLAPLGGPLKSAVSSLFYDPLLYASGRGKDAARELTGSSFRAQVCEAFSETLAGRYPFAASGRDAMLQDAIDFFSEASGTAWTFFQSSLKQQLNRNNDRFVARSDAVVGGDVVDFYTRAWRVTRALFPRGSDKPRIRFEIKVHPVTVKPGERLAITSVVLQVGDQKKTYHNGPVELWSYEWPRPGESRLVVRGARGARDEKVQHGDWSLMKLIEQAKVRKRGSWYELRWPMLGGKVTVRVDVRPSRSDSPLFARRLRIRCR